MRGIGIVMAATLCGHALAAEMPVLPPCDDAAAAEEARTGMVQVVQMMGREKASFDELKAGLTIRDFAEVGFDEARQMRGCQAIVNYPAPSEEEPHAYGVSYVIQWEDRAANKVWAHNTGGKPLRPLPACDSETALGLVKQVALRKVPDDVAAGTPAETLMGAMQIGGAYQLAFDADAQKRACRAAISLSVAERKVFDGSTVSYDLTWSNRFAETVYANVRVR